MNKTDSAWIMCVLTPYYIKDNNVINYIHFFLIIRGDNPRRDGDYKKTE